LIGDGNNSAQSNSPRRVNLPNYGSHAQDVSRETSARE
jgi:hypothetical protein